MQNKWHNSSLFPESIHLKRQQLLEVYNKYRKKYSELYSEAEQNVVRKEYSKGGQVMHRGYYCPSLIEDIICSNVNRGKKYIRLTKSSKPDFEYWFDKNDNLILTKSYAENLELWQTEFIIYETDIVKSVYFSTDNKDIDITTLCQYKEGKLVEYIRFFSDNLEIEKYYYKDNILKYAETETYIFDYKVSYKNAFSFNYTNGKYTLI